MRACSEGCALVVGLTHFLVAIGLFPRVLSRRRWGVTSTSVGWRFLGFVDVMTRHFGSSGTSRYGFSDPRRILHHTSVFSKSKSPERQKSSAQVVEGQENVWTDWSRKRSHQISIRLFSLI